MRRRQLASAAALSCISFALPLPAFSRTLSSDPLTARLRELEAGARGRLGVHMLDTESGREFGYRADERFLMLSSFKLLASALVLQRVDQGREALDRRIPYTKADLVSWSPVTEKHVTEGMTLAQLCEATITTSDNTAANLILKSYGGPASLTAFVRTLGDGTTRFDRYETGLNVRHAAEPEMDTTTPRAMLHSMHKVVLGNALSEPSRRTLQQWLLNNTTGGQRLKAGISPSWRIGDKTGTSRTGANDIGIAWPPDGKPLLVTAYLAESTASAEMKEATLARVGALLSKFASY